MTAFAVVDECAIWEGRESRYQEAAHEVLYQETGRTQLPWTWIETPCGRLCLNPDHMRTHAPRELPYPPGVCVYCGLPSQARDHLLPVTATGATERRYVLTVPACTECNSAISDKGGHAITVRRKIAHDYLAKKHRELLATADRTPAELREYGPTLRSHIVGNIAKRAQVRGRLEWPDDPDYDERAFQKAGVEDPIARGLV